MGSSAVKRLRVIGAILGTLVLVAVVALVWFRYAPRKTPKGQPPLQHLDAELLSVLRTAFNRNLTSTRLLVMLSPT